MNDGGLGFVYSHCLYSGFNGKPYSRKINSLHVNRMECYIITLFRLVLFCFNLADKLGWIRVLKPVKYAWHVHNFADMWRQYMICNKIHSGMNDEISEYHLFIRSYCEVLRGKVDTSQGKKLPFVTFNVTVHRDKFLIIKRNWYTNFSNLFSEWNSTCFGQFVCPSSGVFRCKHSNGICHKALTACEQDQDRTQFHPDPTRKLSANLYDIYHCCVYSEKLLMMDRRTVRNM